MTSWREQRRRVEPQILGGVATLTGLQATFLYRLAKQMIGYFGVAVVAALTEWTTFYVCDGLLRLNVYLSTILAFFCGTLVNFLVGRRSVFRRQASRGLRSVRDGIGVYATSAVGLGLNLSLMWLLTGRIGLQDLPAKIVATGLVFFWNFFAQKLLVYKASVK